MKEPKLQATTRETGKGAVRKLRRSGFVPVVLYGQGSDPQALKLAASDVERMLTHTHGMVLALDYPGGRGRVLLREVRRDPISGKALHMDLQLVRKGERVEARVPLMVKGEEELRRHGLMFSWLLDHVTVSGEPDKLPDHLSLDVSQLDAETTLHARDLRLVKGLELLTNADEPVAALQFPAVAPAAENDDGSEA